MKTRLLKCLPSVAMGIVLSAIVLGALTRSAQAGDVMSSPDLPPIGNDVYGLPTGYLSPAAVHALYSGPGLTVVLNQVIHQPFSLISRVPGPAGSQIETFQSTLDAMATINGAPPVPFHAEGPVMTRVDYGGGGPLGTFTTEMLSMDLTGGGVMIRESPTLASQGLTQIQNDTGGFRIDSFFDVFTELSVDGGANWIPNSEGNGSTHVEFSQVPEPSSFALLGIGLVSFTAYRWRRKSRNTAA